MELKSINEVISNGYCLGCGLCHAIEKNTEIAPPEDAFFNRVVSKL